MIGGAPSIAAWLAIAIGAGAMAGVVASSGAAQAAEYCPVITVAEALAAGPNADCVIIEAWDVQGRLMDDPVHRYAQERRYNEPSSTGLMLGLRHWDHRFNEGAGGALRVRLRGQVRQCEEARGSNLLPQGEEARGGNLLPQGEGIFCAVAKGLYFDSDKGEVLERRNLVRVTAAHVATHAAGQGNLIPLAAGAVRDDMALWYQNLAGQHRRAGGELAGLPEDAVIQILGWRTPLWADQAGVQMFEMQAEAAAEVYACAMDASGAARNLWPISTQDVGLADGRPYVCAHVYSERGALKADFGDDLNPAQEPQ